MGFFKKTLGGGVDKLIRGESPDYGKEAARAEADRQKRIQQGLADVNTTFAGFTPTFYDDRAKAYVDYALPQVAQQYQATRNQLLTGLAGRGLLSSSAGRKQGSTLERTAQGALQTVAEAGRTQAQDLEKQVEDKRQAIIGQLYQSADPANARMSSVTTAAGFRQPSTFAPIANMFSNLSNQFYTNALLEATRQQNNVPTYNDYDWSAINPVGGGYTSRKL